MVGVALVPRARARGYSQSPPPGGKAGQNGVNSLTFPGGGRGNKITHGASVFSAEQNDIQGLLAYAYTSL